jgi:glutamate transport system permease protein
MQVLIENSDNILAGFRTTLVLFVVAAVGSLVLGTVLTTLRVSPVPTLRAAGTLYVNVARNLPLVVVFIFISFGLPQLGIRSSFFVLAALALTLYTAAFVSEALRSGINAVHAGQAEAARSVGMTFGQTLSLVVLPQAFRTVVPPLASILIALAKNTAVAEAFGVTEASYQLDSLVRDRPDALYTLFFGIAFGYLVITLATAGAARLVESKVAIAR